MTYQAKNNAYSTLAGSLTNVATSLTVQTGHGDRFPIIIAPDYTIITLEDASGNREVLKVSARAGAADVMTIVRAQEGTTARAWAAGDSVELRMTAGQVQDMFNHIGDEIGAHSANNITNVPAGNLIATDVQGALNELQTDIDTRATAASVTAQIAALVDSSPLALDTLNELAAALADDPNFATTITNALALKAPLASPTLTGTPAAPTAVLGTNTTQVATTAFVKAAVDAIPVVPDASATVKGIIELLTDAEYVAGTDTTRGLTAAVARANNIVLDTPQATTSGTYKDFTVPAWAKEVKITFKDFSTNGASNYLVQLGDIDGIENTAYTAASSANGATVAPYTTGFGIVVNTSAAVFNGEMTLTLQDPATNTWIASGVGIRSDTTVVLNYAGKKSLSAALTTVRVTTVNGIDTLDAGAVGATYK